MFRTVLAIAALAIAFASIASASDPHESRCWTSHVDRGRLVAFNSCTVEGFAVKVKDLPALGSRE